MKQGLEDNYFKQSKVDPCVFISNNIIVLTYVDDCISLGKDEAKIKSLIKSLAGGEEKIDLTDEGEIKNYLGVDFNKKWRRFVQTQATIFNRKDYKGIKLWRRYEIIQESSGEASTS